MGTSAADMQRLFGKVILFVGVEAQHWTLSTFQGAAKLARSLGVDTISPKRCDGSIKWYDTAEQLHREREAVLAEGVGYAPFLYAYGPKFGDQQIRDECACLAEMASANDGCVIVDMETEWDGQVAAASLFESIMRPLPLVLGITTWADPTQQGWLGVAQALSPCANLWIPQQYDNWLANQPVPAEETILQPGVDLSSEFGPNDVLDIVKRIAARGQSAWLWDYNYAVRNQPFTRTLAAILHGEPHALDQLPVAAIAAGESATPDAGFSHAYVTTAADTTLAEVGAQLGIGNWYEQLYKPNMEAIEQAARAAGHPGSSSGVIIVAGVKLNYN